MQIPSSPSPQPDPLAVSPVARHDTNASHQASGPGDQETDELKEAFTQFVGQTMFGSMLASMRKTQDKPAYLHGGKTEEVFQQQLDQEIVKELTESSAGSVADPMFELFNLQRR